MGVDQTHSHAETMRALGEMAAGIAHEVNSPLSVILGRVSLLQELLRSASEEAPDREAVLASLQQIEVTARQIERIVRGLTMVSRDSRRDPFQEVSLREVVGNTLEFCRHRLLEKGIDLKLIFPSPSSLDELPVQCRPSQIAQVLVNLINNAVDSLEQQSGEERWIAVSVGLDRARKNVRIAVSDSGPGVPREIREKIMQAFFTTKPPGKGTGLGLSVSSAIARSHGGNLYLDRGKAARFVFRWPIRQESDCGKVRICA